MEGKDVSIVEMLDEIAGKAMLVNRPALLKMLEKYKVKQLTGRKILAFTAAGVTVENKDGGTEEIPADTVVLSIGTRPLGALVDRICNKYPTAKVIGDCDAIGQVGEAVRAGFFAAWALD
jgi:NADH dehydrogenase FAD-containing subunit